MRKVASLVVAAAAAAGIGSVGTTAPAEAGGYGYRSYCPPAYVYYYAPVPCCYQYSYTPYYYRTTQYWPVRPYYHRPRVVYYGLSRRW
jgi:hypothetical protein